MTSLELIEYTIVTNGFAHDKVVAMGYSYSDLKKYCEENGLKMFAFVEQLIRINCKSKRDIYGE